MERNFDKYDNSFIDTHSYDHALVMHYERYPFTSNGLPTIVPTQPNVEIGQRYNMSTLDIQKVRLFYNCSSKWNYISTYSYNYNKEINNNSEFNQFFDFRDLTKRKKGKKLKRSSRAKPRGKKRLAIYIYMRISLFNMNYLH